ncbi:hypothetical protein AMTRI_Chr02g215830 [Amborella trichopoda]
MEKLKRVLTQIAYNNYSAPFHYTPLLPILSFASKLYGFALFLRHHLYAFGLFKSKRLPVPVISVGNLTWGGNGKTPMVEFLSLLFSRSGICPLILTRSTPNPSIRKQESKFHIANLDSSLSLTASSGASLPSPSSLPPAFDAKPYHQRHHPPQHSPLPHMSSLSHPPPLLLKSQIHNAKANTKITWKEFSPLPYCHIFPNGSNRSSSTYKLIPKLGLHVNINCHLLTKNSNLTPKFENFTETKPNLKYMQDKRLIDLLHKKYNKFLKKEKQNIGFFNWLKVILVEKEVSVPNFEIHTLEKQYQTFQVVEGEYNKYTSTRKKYCN